MRACLIQGKREPSQPPENPKVLRECWIPFRVKLRCGTTSINPYSRSTSWRNDFEFRIKQRIR